MRYGREIFLATLLICIGTVAAYWFLHHQPLARERVQLELERQRATQRIIDVLNFKNEHGDLDEYMLDIEQQRLAVDTALPQQMFQGEFINYIQQTAREKQVRLISLMPGAIKEDDSLPLERLPLRIKIECDYFKLLDFLKALEESERLINLEKFSVTSIGTGEKLTCELNVVLFAINEEEDINNDAEIFDGGGVARTAIDGDT